MTTDPERTPSFQHVLLTRFSAVLHAGQPPVSQGWLDYRMAFFYDACYPSVTRQRGADFDWLILFDDRCDDDFRELVEDLAQDAFTPAWTHVPFRRNSFAAPVADHLAGRGPSSHLITTRIDSDDAMAMDFMAAVQSQFAGQDRLFVNFPRGIQIDRSGAVYRSDILSSPFLSLIERRTTAPPDTVYVAKHAWARAHGPVREVQAPVMWAQVVHGINLSNIVNGVRVPPAIVAERFDFDLGYDAAISGMPLARAQARHLAKLSRLWSTHPGELTKWAEARAWTLRGTHERAQDDGQTLSDRMLAAERSARQAWQDSGLRRRLSTARGAARDARWRLRGEINARVSQRLVHLAGDLEAVLAAPRVVVLAEYATTRALRPDALAIASAYAAAGLSVLIVAASDPWRRLRVAEVPAGVAVVRRPNAGYDFGSWSAALAAYPILAGKDLVVLTNDSLLGPFGPLDDLVARIDRAQTDVWGPTEYAFPRRYVQSYFLAFRGGVLQHQPVRDFFATVRPQRSKLDVIHTYEVGLAGVLDAAGLSYAAEWTAASLGLPEGTNVCIDGWRQLLDAGFPFVKRTLIELEHLAPLRVQVLDYLAKRDDWAPGSGRSSSSSVTSHRRAQR
ncbi:MAG: glycosyltransferase [Tetrasphaera sp.]